MAGPDFEGMVLFPVGVEGYSPGAEGVPVSIRLMYITTQYHFFCDELEVMEESTRNPEVLDEHIPSKHRGMAAGFKKESMQKSVSHDLNHVVQQVKVLPIQVRQEIAPDFLKHIAEAQAWYAKLCEVDPEYAEAEKNTKAYPIMNRLERLEGLLKDPESK